MTTERTGLHRLARNAALKSLPVILAAQGLLALPAYAADMAAVAARSATPTIVTDTPVREAAAPLGNMYRVSAEKTPSGFAVPRFVSLKFGKVNARTGPSRNHSIAYQYQRRGLPLIVVAETEMWRKVRDIHGDEAWVRKPALSGASFAVTTADAALYTKPSRTARLIARIETGALVELEDCTDADYCRIKTRNGIKGFMPRQLLWGAQDIN